MPIGAEDKFTGVIDLVKMKAISYKDETMGADYVVAEIPADMLAEAKEYREKLIEKVSEHDDKLLEKYLGGEEITEAEIKAALRKRVIESVRDENDAVRASSSAARRSRTRACSRCSTRSSTTCRRRSTFRRSRASIRTRRTRRRVIERPAVDSAPFSALAFKIMTDPFVGQLTFIRVYSGVLTSGSSVVQLDQGQAPSASAASSRCTPTSARKSRRSTPATSPRRSA